MTIRIRLMIILGLAVALLAALLVWRAGRKSEFMSPLSPLAPRADRPISIASPSSSRTSTPFHSPLDGPASAVPPVTTATVEAIRATRPTAAPPSSPEGIRLPYISPNTWRVWALRILIAAGVLAYLGMRLRQNQ